MLDRHAWLAGAMTLSSIAVAGCGGDTTFDVAPVSGQVKMDGKPLAKVIVTFSPTEGGREKPLSVGTTDSEGRFTLRTSTGQMGAIPGMHNVMIADTSDLAPGESLPDDRSQWKTPDNPIPEKYSNPEKPEFTFSVPPKGSESANFEIKKN